MIRNANAYTTGQLTRCTGANRGHKDAPLFKKNLMTTQKRRVLNQLYEPNLRVDAARVKDICVRVQQFMRALAPLRAWTSRDLLREGASAARQRLAAEA